MYIRHSLATPSTNRMAKELDSKVAYYHFDGGSN